MDLELLALGFSSLGVGGMGQRVRQVVSGHGKLSPIPSSDTCKIPALEQGPWKEHQIEDRRYKEVSPPFGGSVSSSAKLVE